MEAAVQQNKAANLKSTIEQLQRQFGQHIIQSATKLNQSQQTLGTGLDLLDQVLNGGILTGQMTELRAIPGHGASTLAMHMLAAAQADGHVGLFIDLADAFDAATAHHIGISVDPSHFLLVTPTSTKHAFVFIQATIHARLKGILVIRPDLYTSMTAMPWSRLRGELVKSALAIIIIQPRNAKPIEAAATRLELRQLEIAGQYQTQITIAKHPTKTGAESIVLPSLTHFSVEASG